MHHIDIKITPPSVRDVLCSTVDFRPIALLQFSAHHARDLRRKQSMSEVTLIWREGDQSHNQPASNSKGCDRSVCKSASISATEVRNSSNPISASFAILDAASHSEYSLRKSHSS